LCRIPLNILLILPVLLIEFAYSSLGGLNPTSLMLVIPFLFHILPFMIRVKHQGCHSAIVVGVQLHPSVVDRRTEMLATDGVQIVPQIVVVEAEEEALRETAAGDDGSVLNALVVDRQ
jgi:hypothetical protein